ncbi:NCS1 family nucleobase:cation symporter-1 [Nonomuraea thailandensis]|uniref:NCS1 family nucleobase:cation symporter-1 n=1 Tax=Nonomuraea thailandensis TaxID=1188745 RepID=A0A9X2GIQ9_9ACTN|nr:cytosine permease [Nonomuraea thailandensis]MCP2358264.1 NCS1 family nucleobase:cation symporter-1 [Nonomuraea thailandensis]
MSTPAPSHEALEIRTIEHIPIAERHGRASQLFTIWFGSNIMLLTIATGLLGTLVYGLSIPWAIAALVLGNLAGGVVMALHAAQGPQMGVPQMLQTRAQFGSQGSLLVVVIVVAMYTAFFASNMVLGGQGLSNLTGLDETLAITVIGAISAAGAIFGYKIIHAMAGVMSVVAGSLLVLAFVMLLAFVDLPAATWSSGGFGWAGFMGTVSLAALWQIAYAPYVSDYTRYLPRDTGVRAAFWATYAGSTLGSIIPMIFGAVLGAAFPALDTVGAVRAGAGPAGAVVLLVFVVGIVTTNTMNLYCGALSVLTIGQTLRSRWQPQAKARSVVVVALFVVALGLAQLGKGDFLTNFVNFMLLLLCALVPWTAVNLVDYYLVRHGEYDISALFRADGGVYGRYNVPAIGCYVIGIAVQIPFLSNALYVGPLAEALHGVDVSWIAGLAIISPLYYFWVRGLRRSSGARATTPDLAEAEGV